ncbi:MAG: DNA-directed RNA polymerase subunit omega [Candidatus Competibacteraceae bacterium]|nr:DNA-directed RNA polymerase subunit omega [Candidatus Competibacteraceae bacterium]
MNLKKIQAETTTVTRDVTQLNAQTGNVYESLSILGKRANQVQGRLKEELQNKLEEFASHTDNLEEVFENREQIEISRHYEKLPKPAAIAYQEWLDEQVYFRKPEEEA